MARSTAELRRLYSPHCTTKDRGKGFYDAWAALDICLVGWNYSPRHGETWGYNCRRITGGAGYSLHAYRDDQSFKFWNGVSVVLAVAVDINSRSNPYGKRLITDMPRPMVDAILAIRTNSGHAVFRWGGYFSGNKDAMHFEIVASPAELGSGINWATVRVPEKPGQPVPTPPSDPWDDLFVPIFLEGDD